MIFSLPPCLKIWSRRSNNAVFAERVYKKLTQAIWLGSVFVWDIYKDVLYPAFANAAQIVERDGADGLVVLQAI